MAENGASGMTNADFARIFRQQARQEEAPTDDAVQAEKAPTADAHDDFQPRGFGFGASRRNDFMTRDQVPQLGFDSERQGTDEDEGTSHRDGGLGASTNGSAGLGAGAAAASGGIGFQTFTRASEASDEPKKKEALAMSKAQLASLGKWEKHTKGFGMKMLSKMGFKGRLGKDERGVSSTVEVVQRPALMGIGYGNFTEASALKHNRKLQRELKGETVEDEAVRKRHEAEALDEDDSLWRKRKVPVVGGGGAPKKYKRAADVSHEAKMTTKRSDVILDMRGPDVRVLSNVSDAYDVDPQRLDAAKPKIGEELIFNVRTVVNLAQGQICDLTSKLDRSDANVASLKKEAEIIKAQVAMETVRLQHIDAMMTRMKQLEQETESALESRDIRGIVTLLSGIREASPQEFEAYKLHQLVSALCIPPLKALLTAVNLTKVEMREATVQQYRLIQIFLLQVPSGKRHGGEATGGSVFYNIHEKVNSAGEDIYNFILEETLWPTVSQFVNYQWSVKTAPEECIELFELFRPHLSLDFQDAFLRQLVLPRLKKECQRWDPQSDTSLIHDWLLPWVPYLGDAMQSLYPDIRLALANALNQWHPSDLSVLAVLSPWKPVWGEHEYAKFTHRHVVRKLIRCLHRDFEINPQQQSLEALTWVFAWKDYLPERQFVALFEGEFFPKWLKVLRRWVATEAPNLMELEKWYRGWKGLFDKQQLAQHRRLVVHFHGALVLLETASDRYYQQQQNQEQGQLADIGIPSLNKKAPTSYQDALVKAHEEDPTAEDGISSANDDGLSRSASTTFQYQEQQTKKKKANHHHAVGLKDVIENLAIAHNVMFMPKGRHDGQQVYLFGKHHILIEQGVVFAEKSKGAFQPIDIEQLL